MQDGSEQNGADKVLICHRTNAIKNPYTQNSVDADSVDGDGGNDNGQGDHYLEHIGPIANPATMTNGGDWGDIIPPVDGVHGGLNWDATGQAIYRAGCNYPGEEEFTPDTSVSGVCDVDAQVVRLTFVNNGNAASDVTVNGAASVVAAGATVNVTTPITGATVSVDVTIDGEPQTITVTCPSGGSGTVTPRSNDTPKVTTAVSGGSGAAGVASLPVTSSDKTSIAAIGAAVTSALTAAGAYILRTRGSAM